MKRNRLKRLLKRTLRSHRSGRRLYDQSPAEVLEDRTLLATINVTILDDVVADDGEVSLREAITQANGSAALDEIVLPAGTYTLTLTGSSDDDNVSGDLDLSSEIIIRGSGAEATIIDAGGDDGIGERVIHALGDANVTIEGVTIRGGRENFGGGVSVEESATLQIMNSTIRSNIGSSGGGILSTGTLTVSGSTIELNTAGFGAGILSRGSLTVFESTISDNTANIGGGGGIMNARPGAEARIISSTINGNSATTGGGIWSLNASLVVVNSTISGNTGTEGSGGILNFSDGVDNTATAIVLQSTITGNQQDTGGGAINSGFQNGSTAAVLQIGNSIIVGNTGGEGNVFEGDPGSVISLGHNLADDDANGLLTATGDQTSVVLPAIDPMLADNGGPTLTHALVPGSNAIDVGNNSLAIDPGPDHVLGTVDDIALTNDQRLAGFDRIVDGTIDIGAVESQKFSLDVDDDQQFQSLSDGLLFVRFLAGFTGDSLVAGAVNETGGQRTAPDEIIEWLTPYRTTFMDVDGDGESTALGDGLMLIRFLAGFTGESLISGAISPDGTRTTAAQVESWLGRFTDLGSSAGPVAANGLISRFPTVDSVEIRPSVIPSFEVSESFPIESHVADQQSIDRDWRVDLQRPDSPSPAESASRPTTVELDLVFADPFGLLSPERSTLDLIG